MIDHGQEVTQGTPEGVQGEIDKCIAYQKECNRPLVTRIIVPANEWPVIVKWSREDPWLENTWGDEERDIIPLAKETLSGGNLDTFLDLLKRWAMYPNNPRHQEMFFDRMAELVPELLYKLPLIYEDVERGGYRLTRSRVLEKWLGEITHYDEYEYHRLQDQKELSECIAKNVVTQRGFFD